MRIRQRLGVLTLVAVLVGACSSPVTIATPTAPPRQATNDAPAETPISNLQSPPPSRDDTSTLLARLGGKPCPDSEFTCVTLTVPLDHFNSSSSETIDVVFGVLPASGQRKGMFVIATGGPGSSGLLSADPYTEAFDLSIPEHFDIVFFDQRGIGASGGLQCPEAAAAFYMSDLRTDTPAGEAATMDAAREFAADCVEQMGQIESLPYLGTQQAVEDLEAFRQAMGDEKFWLYGESYGTQFAQTYAAAHPDHLAGLILDGTVDLTMSAIDYLKDQAQAFNDVLVMTLEACNADEVCADDVGGDAVAAYDELAARTYHSPLTFDFPLPSGGFASREFTLSDLEAAAVNSLYSEDSRMLFVRALAAAARDDDVAPFARLAYDALGLDEQTLEAVADPSSSDAAFYAVECNDYYYFSGTPEDQAAAYLQAGDGIERAVPRLSSVFYSNLPCAFWPVPPVAEARAAPLLAAGVPTLVLNAAADPATPPANGERVFARLADGYLVTQEGGPHVIFGRGDECPDRIVTAFLVEGRLPAQRETTCDGVVMDEYVPLAPRDAREFADALDAMYSAETEVLYLPEYYYWDTVTPTAVGCPNGGTLAFEPSDEGERFALNACEFSAGWIMTGTGEYNYDADRFTLAVSVTGDAEGELVYVREGESIRVSGRYDGHEVDLSG